MARQITPAAADKLISMEVPRENVKVMDERIQPFLLRAVEISARIPLIDQLRTFARNVYLQGLIDGAQVSEHQRSLQ